MSLNAPLGKVEFGTLPSPYAFVTYRSRSAGSIVTDVGYSAVGIRPTICPAAPPSVSRNTATALSPEFAT